MIIVDFSHLSMRCLFVSTEQSKKNGFARVFTADKKLDISCYKNFYLHLLFNNLASIKKEFVKYGSEIVLAIDARNSWRKEFYSEYKASRKSGRDNSDIDFDQYFVLLEKTIEVITENFPFKVVRANKAEGDDIIAVLCKNAQDKVLVVSEDKDFRQLLKYDNVNIYRPIQKTFTSMNKKELTSWKAQHILGGDAGDGVPTIKADTEFSLNFIKYLRENEIFELDVQKFNSLSISKKLYSEYTVKDKKGNLDIFKPARFGEKGIADFALDLRKNLKEKKIYWKNYNRNKVLVMFDCIPKEVQETILESYKISKVSYNPLKIKSYFDANELRYLSTNVQMFYDKDNEITASKGMFEAWI